MIGCGKHSKTRPLTGDLLLPPEVPMHNALSRTLIELTYVFSTGK